MTFTAMTTEEWVKHQRGLDGDEYRRSFDAQCAIETKNILAQWDTKTRLREPLTWRTRVRSWFR